MATFLRALQFTFVAIGAAALAFFVGALIALLTGRIGISTGLQALTGG